MPEQKRTGRGVLGGFLGFIGLSVAAGLLVTAAITPAIAVTGVTANNAISVFDGLPDYLKVGKTMEKTNIWANSADGQPVLLASFFDQNRDEVAWDQVSQYAKDAAVAAEDPRFYSHGGIDVMGTTRAVLKTYIGGDTQGGSSITQQYVKNVLVQQCEIDSTTDEELNACANDATTADGAEGAGRKLKEMRFAIGVEKDYSKDEILLGYLNIANFGARTYGIQAASSYYFGVNAADLTIEQAATLIAIVNYPSSLRIDMPESESNGAANGYAKTLERRNYVITKMLEEGKITQEQHDAARAVPVTPSINPPSTGCQTAGDSAYFCDYVTRVVKNDPVFGETAEARAATLRRGGLQIYTSLDPDLQAASAAAINEYLPKSMETVRIGGAAVTVQPGTGRVLAMAQNKTYSNDPEKTAPGGEFTSVNYNTDYKYGGSSGFDVGSTFKSMILLDWLKNGHSLRETVSGEKRTFSRWTDSCSGNYTKSYTPVNYDGTSPGQITPIEATKRSVNTAFIAMAQKLDMCDIFQTAEDMGVHRADGDPLQRHPATLLGSNEIAPLSLATAIAGIAAQGLTCTPVAIDKITGPDGEEIAAPKSQCTQAVTPEVANTAAFALETVFEGGGTAARAAVPGAPLMGKTGTADEARHSWITGGTTKAVTSLWVGNVVGQDSMYDVRVKKGVTGFSAKFGIFSGILRTSIAKYGGDNFGTPDDALIRAKQIKVPDVTGQSVEAATAALTKAGFGTQVGEPVASSVGAGLVASTSPGPGASVSTGSTITIQPSTGTPPQAPEPEQPEAGSVPNVVGKQTDAARSDLAAAGYSKVKEACQVAPGAAGKPEVVAAQNPEAGAEAGPDSEVTITIAKQKC
ncbi:transglycosylase domain-containing protein [Mycetocola miduiensis]|uniref:Membrane carboxypeptidase (Penicillin-binding protein) n=1 Tax=Mycetocola miduiensis TaxID=995034 RepID=A0A1I4YAR2_9MICO|nr:transglycosylase domain-containing protein [Mycetocola miduiensis]SFN35078.1 Membrane carboxypeptidase (penicillin-binding protein) [Mycetocola miduiensis]